VFRYLPAVNKSEPFDPAPAPIDASQFETKQFFAPSKDGTKVPFFLTAQRASHEWTQPDDADGLRRFLDQHAADLPSDVPAWLERGGSG
jgi:prolyl oligopeptidase PreP (S9A serine peptidase family)